MRGKNAQVIAVSTDKPEKQAAFREKLGAPYPFIADTDAALTKLYDVKMPVVKVANRVTFVIGTDGKILRIETGGDAIDPTGALEACPVPT